MAASYKAFMIWMPFILLLMFLQGYEASLCKSSFSLSSYYRYCAYGCCYSNSFSPCCSTTYYRYTGLSSNIYWIIASSVLTCIGLIIGVIVCCCCRRRRANAGTIVNGTTSQFVVSSNSVQTNCMQPGIASPVQQPVYYPPTQAGYYPPQPQPGYYPPQPQPGYYPPQPQPDNSAPPPSYETLASGKQTTDTHTYETLGNAHDNKGFN